MEKVKSAINGTLTNTIVVGLLCWVGFMTITFNWPASFWMEVRAIELVQAKAGHPVIMMVDRTIKRDFVASWVVSVRRAENGMDLVCVGSGTSNYRSGAEVPKSLTLGWWTGGGCNTLEPGRYFVATDWRIHPQGIFPAKSIKFDSGPFEVTE
jgi:hypothetical protein